VVEVAGGLGVPVDRPAVQRRPAAIRARRVRDDRVGVQLRIPRSAGAIAKRRHDEPVAAQKPPAALAAPRERRLTLQIPQRPGDRLVVCVAHHPGRPRVGKTEQDRSGLRCTERQVKPRDIMLALRLPQPRLAAARRRAGEHRRERLIVHAAVEPQQPRAAPQSTPQAPRRTPGSSPRGPWRQRRCNTSPPRVTRRAFRSTTHSLVARTPNSPPGTPKGVPLCARLLAALFEPGRRTLTRRRSLAHECAQERRRCGASAAPWRSWAVMSRSSSSELKRDPRRRIDSRGIPAAGEPSASSAVKPRFSSAPGRAARRRSARACNSTVAGAPWALAVRWACERPERARWGGA